MKVIGIEHPHSFCPEDFPPLAMALGFFDGVHKGHQKVIRTAIEVAQKKGLKSAVMTFHPHPSVVLGKKKDVHYITPVEEKIHLISDLGVDYIFVVHFSKEFANLLPQEFVDQYIISFNVKHVVAGFDYSYGRLGKGTMETIPFHSRSAFSHTVVEKQTYMNDKVSSTRIREALLEGDFIGFEQLTGRKYQTKGVVIHGEKRGRKLGFPTANIGMDQNYIIPATGVYAVRILIRNKWYEGVCNIGYKPTFHQDIPDIPNVEVHIFSFDSDIYDEMVTIEWHKRLRSEKKFSGLEELVTQIQKDKNETLQYFRNSQALS
ncbi:bifunctional riboflavin kinase/FAD synthetase [Peribacillus tepidiphilus]|uniref:bifunctional riboflavin kinase/FAD synthetase n=1 Tax=Peribacillus tepidiphilus TaxID=2652445 RepID=UPI001290DB48|nr:bifunctional riboflavin kinase/FAD synthetase [Peribacillus tepidiphilus]